MEIKKNIIVNVFNPNNNNFQDKKINFIIKQKFSIYKLNIFYYKYLEESPNNKNIYVNILNIEYSIPDIKLSKWFFKLRCEYFGFLISGELFVIKRSYALIREDVYKKYKNFKRDDFIAYKIGRQNRIIMEKANTQQNFFPVQIYIGLTHKCNRRCIFCSKNKNNIEYKQLSKIDFYRVLTEIKDFIKVIALTGWGEVLIHPDFFQILNIINKLTPKAILKLNTNGIVFKSNKYCEQIFNSNIKNITISINSINPAIYYKIHNDKLENCINGVRNLILYRANKGLHNTIITGSMVLMNSNIKELPNFVKFCFEEGLDEVQGIYLMVKSKELLKESLFYNQNLAIKYFDKAYEMGEKLGIKVYLPPKFKEHKYKQKGSSNYQLRSLAVGQQQKCVEPWSTIYLRADGNVMSCPYYDGISLGNISKLSIKEIWTGKNYSELRKSIMFNEDRYNMCKHCSGFNESSNVDDLYAHIDCRENIL